LQELRGRDVANCYGYKNELWLTANDPLMPRKYEIYCWDGKRLKYFPTPNSDQIYDLKITGPNEGWACGAWGQMLHYDGRGWRLVEVPTPYHIAKLFFSPDRQLYAMIRKPRKDVDFLKLDNGRWLLASAADLDKLPMYPTMAMLDVAMAKRSHPNIGSSLIRQRIAATMKAYWEDSTPQDSLMVYISFIPHNLLCFGLSGDARNPVAGRFPFTSGARDLIFPYYTGIDQDAGWNSTQLVFFSKTSLEHTILIRTPVQQGTTIKNLFVTYPLFSRYFEHGICISDFNGDGVQDRYAVATNQPNRLYLSNKKNQQDFPTFLESAEEAGVTGRSTIEGGSANYDEGTTCADIDNDGDQDIIVTSLYTTLELYVQTRPTRFREQAHERGLGHILGRAYSAIWGDVNNDGAIDLFVSLEDSSNRLFLNDGAGFFRDVTVAAGLYLPRGGVGSMFSDIDQDGDLDLFVPRYGLRNLLYRNEGSLNDVPRFVEIGRVAGVAGADTTARSSCGVFADVDNDGDPDLFVTNLTCANWLYLNDGYGRFAAAEFHEVLNPLRPSQTAVFLDADQDADLDLYVGNRSYSSYYENLGQGRYIDRTEIMSAGNEGFVTGMAVYDEGEDGDPDLYLADDLGVSRILMNTLNMRNFIKVKLEGIYSNRDGIGSRVYLYRGHQPGGQLVAVAEVNGGSGFNSMSSRTVHFGTGSDSLLSVRVRFPSGIVRDVAGLRPGTVVRISEADGIDRRLGLLAKWWRRSSYKPDNQLAFAIIFIFILFIALSFLRYKRLAWWQWPASIYLVFLPVLVFIGIIVFAASSSPLMLYVPALLVGLAAWWLGKLVAERIYKRPVLREELLEKLFLSSNAFFHGEWGERKLNRLELYCINIQTSVEDKAVLDTTLETINDFFSAVLPEIENMISFAYYAEMAREVRVKLRKTIAALAHSLNQLKVEITLNAKERIQSARLTVQHIQILRAELQTFRQQVVQRFTSDIPAVLADCLRSLSAFDVQWDIQNHLGRGIKVRINPSSLEQIIDNLLRNAIRAVAENDDRRIQVVVDGNRDVVRLRVADSGAGVPALVLSQLFQQQIVRPNQKGGFGLYHAHERLVKFGGTIRHLPPVPGYGGAVFEIQLKRIDHE
jgi:signal transduction histidine kinase